MERPSLKTVSLALNMLLLAALLAREGQHLLLRFQMETEAPSWAKYAGAMQAVADYGNGVRRLYRPALATDVGSHQTSFTGRTEDGVEVWSWTYYANGGECSRLCAEAYADAYDARMRNFIKHPRTYANNGVAATRTGG